MRARTADRTYGLVQTNGGGGGGPAGRSILKYPHRFNTFTFFFFFGFSSIVPSPALKKIIADILRFSAIYYDLLASKRKAPRR